MEGIYALVAFVLGWFVAQLIKTVLGLVGGYRLGKTTNLASAIDYFTRSGGMPSGHTASFVAMTIYIGCTCGFNSIIFALAFATCGIVMYDAIHVRYAVGEQGKALNKLLKKQGIEELPIVEGHTLLQVVVGALLGIVVGLFTVLLTGGFQ